MRFSESALALALACGALAGGCGSRPQPSRSTSQSTPGAAPAHITQFYATAPNLARGEHELLCYGVENARTVRLSPPPQELSEALARCVEVYPKATTTYTLTAEGAVGPPAEREVTVNVGPPQVKIVNVTVSALNVARGTTVSLCYHVENASSVTIEPIRYRAAASPQGCGTDTPQKTTTYTVTALGAEGSRDQEHVTVQVH